MKLVSMLKSADVPRPSRQADPPATSLRDAAAAMKSSADLRAFLHEHCGLTKAEAAEVRRRIMADVPEAKDEEITTRAGLARAFASAGRKREARFQFVLGMVDGSAARARAALTPLPAHVRNVSAELYWLETVTKEMATEFADELEACKDRDQLEARLVRARWGDAEIDDYLDRFGPGA